MRKKGDERQKIVQLKQLVSQPQCLKLLILHTPFTLNLDSLYQCINLVKLDLSKNNLSSFPYLGDLPFLKFMFIHDNKLDIQTLVGIFEEDFGKQTRSPLSKAIVWVTYWGNFNQFNARHYLINHTSVLAVDHHMVVQEQNNQTIFIDKKFIQPFDPITNIQEIFQNRKKFNKNATQEQYMAQFWEDMSRIRKKHIEINSIIKIQKVYRGWSYRLKEARKKEEIIQSKKLVVQLFSAWKRQTKFEKKLKAMFKKKDKQYLLLPIKQMKLEAAKRKIIAFVQNIKKKILLRKMNLKSQYKFYNVLKSNQQALRSLYNVLHIDKSSYLMIHIDGLENFKKYVIPVASSMNGGIEVPIKENNNIALRSLYEPPRKRRQFLRILQLNQKSMALQIKPLERLFFLKKKSSSVYRMQTSLTSNYNNKNIHFSQSDLQKMESIEKSFNNKKKLDLNQLKKVEGNKQLLKDIVRGCYFYNMGYLTNCVVPTQKINFLSQYSIKRISSIIKIQRMWRGVNLRSKIRDAARKNYILNRATVKIQRWFRNLAWNHRKLFMFENQKSLKLFQNQSFYIKMTDYMQILTKINQNQNNWQGTKISFPEQNIKPYICIQNKKLLISWDRQSHHQGAFINSKIGKKLFSQKFTKTVFDDWQIQGPILPSQESKYEKCEVSHLFHYQTQISTIQKKNGLYLQIKCASKYDCRLRVLALRLLTYSFHQKNTVEILPKQLISLYQSQFNCKKSISNPSSIFISQNKSEFEISALSKQNTKTFELFTKFYINNQQNKKPIKFATVLKIVMVELDKKQIESQKKQIRSVSYNQKFDLQNFLIVETNQVRLDKKNINLINHAFSANAKNKKQSLKNIKLERKMKFKNRQKMYSQHSEKKQKQKFNFMLGDPLYQERLTTQPDLLTHERSMGSILPEPQATKKDSLHKSDIKVAESRVIMRKRLGINNESTKAHGKHVQQFTKNFINQGNFIQNQFLYGQIKRLKTEIERNSVDQATRIKTQQNQRVKYLERFKDDKVKRAQQAHLKHKEQQFRSVIEKHTAYQSKQKQKNEAKQSNYKSLPRKMRINFAEQCYPIIGKHPNSNSYQLGKQQ